MNRRNYKLWLDCDEENIPRTSLQNYEKRVQKSVSSVRNFILKETSN